MMQCHQCQHAEDVAAGKRHDAQPFNFQAAGDVGHFDGRGRVRAGRQHVTQHREDHVARAGNVADLPGTGGKEFRTAGLIDPGHAVAIQCDDDRLHAKFEQFAAGVESLLGRRDMDAQGPAGLGPIGRDAGATGVAALVGIRDRIG